MFKTERTAIAILLFGVIIAVSVLTSIAISEQRAHHAWRAEAERLSLELRGYANSCRE